MLGRYNRFYLTNSAHSYDGYDESIGYDAFGRLNSIFNAFNYTYTSNSNLVASLSQSAWGWNYTDSRSYDAHHDWVSNRSFAIGSSTKAAFAYSQDNLGRISKVTKTGALYTDYGNGTQGLDTSYAYDDRSEVIGEKTKLGGSSTVLTGRDDGDSTTPGYAYDSFGNRTGTTHNSYSASYTVNALNQYTQRSVVGIFDIAGSDTASTVTVAKTGGTTDTAARNGNYFFDGYALSNTSSPVYANLTITGSSSKSLPVYVEKTPQFTTASYDNDGNLLADGRWSYTYDGENRLSSAETTSAAVTAGVIRQKLTFGYDYLGRRISKLVQSGWTGSNYANTDLSLHYIYDGWNLVCELDANSSLAKVRSHVWGLDLSGTAQGAGGVGGLLYTYDYAMSASYIPAYDALGNIYAMIKASDGSVAASYEYDAYGKMLRETGTYAASNPHQFSTKYTDCETGLVYYGHRYYSPSLGRFINKDPIEEQGGLNLYAFCTNNGVNSWDYLGFLDSFYITNSGRIDVNRQFTPNPLPPRVTQATIGAWNITVGTVQVVGGISGEVYSGGALTPLAAAATINGTAQVGFGFTQLMSALSGRSVSVPGSPTEALSSATGTNLAGSSLDVLFTTLTVTSNPAEITQLPRTFQQVVTAIDDIKSFSSFIVDINEFLGSESSNSPTIDAATLSPSTTANPSGKSETNQQSNGASKSSGADVYVLPKFPVNSNSSQNQITLANIDKATAYIYHSGLGSTGNGSYRAAHLSDSNPSEEFQKEIDAMTAASDPRNGKSY